MRVLVTGGREYTDKETVYSTLSKFAEQGITITTLVHGSARGLDTLAKNWAEENGILPEAYPITPEEWDKYGKKMGHIRNKKMLDSGVDCLVAFPGGPGTADMISQVEKANKKGANIPIWRIKTKK